MIKSIDIQNFQSHSDTKLELHKGVNIIIGNSDAGKTAIIRALRWVIWNRPSGSSIKSWWGDKTKVVLEVEEGSVNKSKDKQDLYIVKTSSGKSYTLKAFGTSVPEEVSNLLTINEINLQQQLDSPFLLSKTSGQIASYFNKIAKLDEIDLSQKNVQSWIRKLKSDIDHNRKQIIDKKKELKKFDFIEKFEIELEVVEEMEKKLKTLRTSSNKLMDLNASYYDNRIETDLYYPYLELENKVDTTLELYNKKREYEKQSGKLYSIIISIISNKKKIEKEKTLLPIENKVNAILLLYKNINILNNEYEPLSNLISNIKSTERSIKKSKIMHEDLSREFNKSFPDRCPLCGLDVPHDAHDIKHYGRETKKRYL